MSRRRSDRTFFALMGATTISGVAAILTATRWGIGVSYDSVFYLSAADNLLHGFGLSRLAGGGEIIPLTHFPPLYPLSIAAGASILPLTTSAVARLLAAILFGGLVLLTGWLVRNFTNSTWAGAGTALAILSSPVFFAVDAWAMSEALYLVLLGGALWLLADYAERPSWHALLWAGALTGAAYATRYVGASLLATGVLAIGITGNLGRGRRALRVAVYGAVSGLPVLAWMIRNQLLTGQTANRTLVFHLVGRSQVSEAAHSLAGFVLPEAFSFWLRLGIMAALVVILVAFWLRIWWQADRPVLRAWDRPARLGGILAMHALVYGCMLLASLSFFDASTRLDDRILSPLWLILVLLAGLGAGQWLAGAVHPAWKLGAVGLAASLLVASGGVRTWNLVLTGRSDGLGFNSRGWVSSPAVAWVESLDSQASLTSNEAFPLYYLTGRPIYWAPEAIDPVKGLPRPDLPDELEAMRTRLSAPDSYLVIFHPSSLRVEMPPLADLTQGLRRVLATSDAVVYTGR